MKYYEVTFTLSPYSTDACDVLAALAGEVGFETFMETETGLIGYVQQALFDESALQEALTDFPFEGVSIDYDVHEAEDKDWNEQWEQEGFEPIVVKRKEERKERKEESGKRKEICPAIVIHDGRHLPEVIPEEAITIEIDAKLAFGTGTHETTRMVCSALLSYLFPLSTFHFPLRILDCGTGTGILAIAALKLGAREAIGYDIDEWSVDNARHNAVINHVDDRFTSLLGDATILNKVEGEFDIVMANINRNILLADMPLFRQMMAPEACLILSGFYTADIPILAEKAESLGLALKEQKTDHDWACLIFK